MVLQVQFSFLYVLYIKVYLMLLQPASLIYCIDTMTMEFQILYIRYCFYTFFSLRKLHLPVSHPDRVYLVLLVCPEDEIKICEVCNIYCIHSIEKYFT